MSGSEKQIQSQGRAGRAGEATHFVLVPSTEGRGRRAGRRPRADRPRGPFLPYCRAEDIPLVGGGGTDLRTGFARALRDKPCPDVIVVLTDGQTPWPASRPPSRTVVGFFPRAVWWHEDDPDYVPGSPPEWARVVTIGSAPTAR